MLGNISGPAFDLWKWSILNIFGGHFFEKSHSPCGNKDMKNNSTAHTYIYML